MRDITCTCQVRPMHSRRAGLVGFWSCAALRMRRHSRDNAIGELAMIPQEPEGCVSSRGTKLSSLSPPSARRATLCSPHLRRTRGEEKGIKCSLVHRDEPVFSVLVLHHWTLACLCISSLVEATRASHILGLAHTGHYQPNICPSVALFFVSTSGYRLGSHWWKTRLPTVTLRSLLHQPKTTPIDIKKHF